MTGRLRAAVFAAALACASGRLSWQSQAVKFDLFKAGAHPWGLPCLHPVERAPVEFPPELLVGDVAQPVMYSGYVNVTDRDYLFYWFVEAEEGAGKDAPLVVWSNGGPGCSAMEGMTTEHGPLVLLDVKTDGAGFSGRLSKNPYSWHKQAHVLYVDQPRYVGFSCGTGAFTTNSVDAGKDIVIFLRGWRLLFPEHVHRDLVLATESYGGHYIPAWSSAIMDYNEGASDKLTISGILIGNGIVNETIQGYSFTEFARRQGLIPDNYTALTSLQAREAMVMHLGYHPNYYDYRLAEKECCGCSSYDYKPWADWLLREDVARALNVCGDAGNKAFGNCAAGCISLPEFDRDDAFDYSGALGRALARGVKVTFYYGMQDTACNYVGGYAMAAGLDWPNRDVWSNASFTDLLIGGMPQGRVKTGGGLTWIQVANAGHMVPINNPTAAAFALGTLVPKSGRSSAVEVPIQCPRSRELADAIVPDIRRKPVTGPSWPASSAAKRLFAKAEEAVPQGLPRLMVPISIGCLALCAAVLCGVARRSWQEGRTALPRSLEMLGSSVSSGSCHQSLVRLAYLDQRPAKEDCQSDPLIA